MLKISGNNKYDRPDEVLLEEYCSSGNLKALGELYSRYTHLVYGVCLKYLQNREDAKDAVMQIFEKLITDILQHEVKHFRPWLYVLTKNFCLMAIRSKQSADKRFKVYSEEYDRNIMESGPDLHPIDKEQADGNKALMECVEQLNTEQKKCIQLFYFENNCYKEISEKLKIDEKKVKSHLQNGKRNLKICLESKNVKEE